ncbi:MAG TPA: hypothetical protein VFC26_07305, partial [Verrucomicrobiae bacterium]|nr:hypothetical protein [Verrucomicrobiae bacterium]
TMNISGITWRGDSIDDVEILPEVRANLFQILSQINGFILHDGALHVRGASLAPEWHSLRAAWRGKGSFTTLYPNVKPSDIPFAQDQFGDQFLIREGKILRLFAETGEIEPLAESLEDFLFRVEDDIETFLTVGFRDKLQPGELLLAYPPFCFQESGANASLKPVPAGEVISFHADLARQIRDVPDGGQVQIKPID